MPTDLEKQEHGQHVRLFWSAIIFRWKSGDDNRLGDEPTPSISIKTVPFRLTAKFIWQFNSILFDEFVMKLILDYHKFKPCKCPDTSCSINKIGRYKLQF